MSDTARCDARFWKRFQARRLDRRAGEAQELLRGDVGGASACRPGSVTWHLSKPDEIVALARVVAPLGGRYISHMRSEDRARCGKGSTIINIGRDRRSRADLSYQARDAWLARPAEN
jgi:hypothetical protein